MGEEHRSPIRARALEARATAEQIAYLRSKGVTAADHVLILGPNPLIRNEHGGTITIGAHTVLNSDPATANGPLPNPVTFVVGFDARIRIGSYCGLYGASITAYAAVDIGDRVQIGPGGVIVDTDGHPIDPVVRRRQVDGLTYPLDAVEKRPIVIEDDVWIGFGVIVLKGVRIGQSSVIGAGSVVTRDIPPFCVAAGNPARVIRRLSAPGSPGSGREPHGS